jgi:predicted GNAT family acetyltransferase
MMLVINETHHLFYIGNDPKKPEGYIQYTIEDKVLTIWHTEVGESLKGQGTGSALVAYAVNYARQHDLLIKPLCSYALSQFEKKPEYKDVCYIRDET